MLTLYYVIPSTASFYWPSTTKYQTVLPYTDPVPAGTTYNLSFQHPVCMVINYKHIASPAQPHNIYKSLSGRLGACICRWRWECGYLSGQPFLHLKKLCAEECYHGLPLDSKPASYSAKRLLKNSIKQSCHKMNDCYCFKLWEFKYSFKLSHFVNSHDFLADYKINAKRHKMSLPSFVPRRPSINYVVKIFAEFWMNFFRV